MPGKTSIEWAEEVWNPIAGCSKVSKGCQNCYAEKMAKRLVAMGQEKYKGTIDERGRWTGQINFDEEVLQEPLKKKKPTTYFVNSMSDLFHDNVKDEWIAKIFEVMYRADWHKFLVLTKRPERMMEIVNSHYDEFGDYADPSPKHIWLGVSVEDQKAAEERIPYLLDTPAAIRFLSCEPLLGPVDLENIRLSGAGQNCIIDALQGIARYQDDKQKINKIHWVIAGGESGHGARSMRPEWVRSLRDQCQHAGVAFFFKQGSKANWPNFKDFNLFPTDLQIRELPNA